MKSYFAVSQQEEKTRWYIDFLKSKESDLVYKSGFNRIKTQKKVFYCEEGKFNYPFVYVESTEGYIYSPLRRFLGIEKNQNMSSEFRNKLIHKASITTYQKAVEDIENSFGFRISKKTLNRYVINSENVICVHAQTKKQNVLMADSTKVRNGKNGHHEVYGVISLDYELNSSNLIAFEINKTPSMIAETIDFSRYAVFVGDADLGLRNFYQGKLPFQLCHLHAIRDVSFFLWQEGMKKRDRNPFIKRFQSILYTLQNSTNKYYKDNNTERLVNRIVRTQEDLYKLAAELSTIEKHESARFITYHIEHLVTSARLALIGIRVPWTTNHAERLMQEIGIRTKKKGMNWTEKGLKAILSIVLKRYFIPRDRRNYKEVFNKAEKVVEI